MICRYKPDKRSRGNFLAVMGCPFSVFEGHLLPDNPDEACFYTAAEIKERDDNVLEVLEVNDKYKGQQEFVQMGIRWGWRIGDDIVRSKMPHTHEERVKVANEFMERARKITGVYETRIAGSVARCEDNKFSDVDIVVRCINCLGEENCEIAKLAEYYIMEPIEISCNPEDDR